MEKRRPMILTIIGLATILLLVIGATYAYYTVSNNINYGNITVVTGNTDKPATISIATITSELKLKLRNGDMDLSKTGTYYADDEKDLVKTKSEGFHDIAKISVTNSKKDDNIYRCRADINIKLTNSMVRALEKDDEIIHKMGNK